MAHSTKSRIIATKTVIIEGENGERTKVECEARLTGGQYMGWECEQLARYPWEFKAKHLPGRGGSLTHQIDCILRYHWQIEL